VAKAEAHHAAVGEKALEVERLERQRAKLARQRLLLAGRQNLRMIAEPLRQPRGRGEQIGLSGGRRLGATADGSNHPPIDRRASKAVQVRSRTPHAAFRPRPGDRAGFAGSGSAFSSKSSASFSVIAPPSSSASTMVTARR